MVGWHHWLNGHEIEQTPGDSEGQESLACCSPWGLKELDMTLATEQQQQHPPQEYCPTVKGDSLLTHTALWMDLKGVMPNGK